MSDFKANPPYRPATFNDAVFIARLLREFYSKAGRSYGIAYDHETTLLVVEDVIRRGVCIVGPTSCAGAMIEPFVNNCNHTLAVVRFWYFQRPREITIFEELMRVCRAFGATEITGASHPPDHVIGRYYHKLGMSEAETVYIGKMENCCKDKSKRVRGEVVNDDQTTMLGGA